MTPHHSVRENLTTFVPRIELDRATHGIYPYFISTPSPVNDDELTRIVKMTVKKRSKPQPATIAAAAGGKMIATRISRISDPLTMMTAWMKIMRV